MGKKDRQEGGGDSAWNRESWIIVFTIQIRQKDTADFLCKLLIEANACRVERAIEEAASKCAEESEYIAEPGDIEKVEEPVTIRRRRAR